MRLGVRSCVMGHYRVTRSLPLRSIYAKILAKEFGIGNIYLSIGFTWIKVKLLL
jgi:hypothetical protein